MTTLAIHDLGDDVELDHEAMRSHLGGRGLGRSALFAFFLPNSSLSSPNPITFNIVAETFQLNQLNQITKVINSENVITDQFGDQENSNFQALSLPSTL